MPTSRPAVAAPLKLLDPETYGMPREVVAHHSFSSQAAGAENRSQVPARGRSFNHCQSGHPFMKSLFFLAAIALLFPALTASADSVSGEFGVGFIFSSGTEIYLLRYRHETNPIFGLSSYYEALIASWTGPNYAEAAGLARGIRWSPLNDQNLSLTTGLSYISRTTGNLGKHVEFYGRLAYEINVGKALISVAWIHYSDAKFFFGWSGPNNGENFATLSVGMPF
jgi:Lipid A 3-O-deacylase (PagL)